MDDLFSPFPIHRGPVQKSPVLWAAVPACGAGKRDGLPDYCWLMGPAFSAKQAAQQRNQSSADQSDTAAGHQLLHALAFC